MSLLVSPVLLFSVAGWMTRITVVCFLLALAVIHKNREQVIVSPPVSTDAKWLCLALILPLCSVLLGQLFSGRFMASSFDSPMHIIICIGVMLAMLSTHSRVVEWLSHALPLTLLIAWLTVLIMPGTVWGGRVHTKSLDPLAFGSLALTFGLLSLISIKLHTNRSRMLLLYKLLGFALGVYLSIISGSRTGWLALPLVALIWLYGERLRFTWRYKLLSLLCVLGFMAGSYLFSATVQKRVDIGVKEVAQYQWNPIESPYGGGSVGYRISFIRIAYFLLEQQPLSGWGQDGDWKSVTNDPALAFADDGVKKMALFAGFHNEITAKMVESGIWGLISSVAMFLIPGLFFIRKMYSDSPRQRNVALMGMAFLLCQFVSSWSMELTNLRYAASFFGLMIAIFAGQILYYAHHEAMINSKDKLNET
ncbi:O-antigen ligase family protein [Chitinibacter sp. S2-10]|uniref:O-antigen ligase family protein n=1 Tax=Chitinibacter sp. S2-10 TaxID=3373597 RepID=UPI0039775537